ncbi:FxSxx-COOH system tetratricopeptide repeat protein [Micromonospora sediminimaris]|uniref:NTPase n=1 Tax=Micromonospora sediminimaris TaxID=547162 RepID=A0A9W5UQY2_9ACTN|nr:FxSxx-COOH system tetratricopeptide repeat protein [Micromonospora sediminimaris]GIJ33025.1 NTPase [Micromonospora sediminimaris]SFD12754.1 Tetratricopeptide repeat-containing protein [Micromonospora sediminimaris]
MTGPVRVVNSTIAGTQVVAFLAPAGQVGRTRIVSNLGWMLARAGQRVLVVDAGRGAGRVHEHLRMFHVEQWPVAEQLPPDLTRLLFAAPAAAGGTEPALRRYAATPGRLDVVWIADPTPSDPNGAGEASRSELRRQLRFTEYDTVLLVPRVTAGWVAQWVAVLCDTVAVCFPYDRAGLTEAVELGRQVHGAAPAGVRVVSVATGLPEGDPDGVARHRRSAASRFAEALALPAGSDELVTVELPAVASGPALVPLLDRSAHQTRLLDAYGGLLSAVTDGRLGSVPEEAEPARLRYQYALNHLLPDGPGPVAVSYPVAQRPWVDWLRTALAGLGVTMRPWPAPGPEGPGPAPATLLAVAPWDGSADDWLSEQDDQARAAGCAEILVVRTGEPPTGGPPAGRTGQIDLAGCSPETARRRLAGALGLAGLPPVDDDGRDWSPALPGTREPATMFRLPRRRRRFVGRDRSLEELRDLLLSGPAGHVLELRGPAAVGKTSLLCEYAHRFRHDYQLIAWIAADSRYDVRSSLTDLAADLGVEPKGNPVQEVLRELGRRPGQWLLIYDGADEEDLTGLLPEGTGHVVVTRRNGADDEQAAAVVQLGQLTDDEAAQLLTSRVPGLSPASAATVVQTVGGLPLDLRLTSGLLGQAGILLNQRQGAAESRAADSVVPAFCAAFAERDPAASSSTRIVQVALALMGEELSGRMAVVLAQACAFTSPLGMSLRLARSREMRVQLAAALPDADAEMLRLDGWEMDRALATAARYRLLDVDWGRGGRLRMHPVVQGVLLAEMSEAEREERRDQFLRGLADSAQPSVAAESAERRELHRHLHSSGGLDADGPDEVRRLIVEQLEHLLVRGSHETPEALRSWQPVLQRWLDTYGWSDRLTLRLATRLADGHRILGRYAEAHRISVDTLREGLALFGPEHPRVLVTRRGLAGDLRGLGEFRAALVEDQTTWRGFRDQLGNDHPETLVAAHNLTLSFYLAGRADEALAEARRTLVRRQRLLGNHHSSTLRLINDIGRYLCELGEVDQARRLLQDAQQRRQHDLGHRDDDELLLRIIRNLAVTARRQRRFTRAKEINGQAYVALRRMQGADGPLTRSCRASLAVDYHLTGEIGDAVRLVEQSLTGYERDLGAAHPFTHVCRSLRSVLLRPTQAGEAVVEGNKAVAGLDSTLGSGHPWVVAGLINQAGNLSVAGEPDSAEQLLRDALEQGRTFLGHHHPYLRAARRTLAEVISQGEVGGAPDSGMVSFGFIDVEVPET